MPPSYVLLTAARNEAAFIGTTIESVLAQTVLPAAWVIIDDGSTDATSEIVSSYTQKASWIKLVKSQTRSQRDFGSKAFALREAHTNIPSVHYNYIGILDADLSFANNIYATFIQEMITNPKAGLVGGLIWEPNASGTWQVSHLNPHWCIGGATHFFRRALYETIGGYPPLKRGGEDTVVEYLVRAANWQLYVVASCRINHHRPTLVAQKDQLRAAWNMGAQEFAWGSSFIFECVKCLARSLRTPFILGGLARLSGYLWCWQRNKHTDVDVQTAVLIKTQQLQRLHSDFHRFVFGKKGYLL